MKNKLVKNLIDVVLVPFLEIKPSDVLFLENLVQKLHPDGAKTQGEYFLWAQSAGSFTDIWFLDKDKISEHPWIIPKPIFDDTLSPQFKVEAYLPSNKAVDGVEVWNEKRIHIPLTTRKHKKDNGPFMFVSQEVISDMNDSHNYFNKQCWVLRACDNSDVTPLALSFFISDAVKDTSCNFKSGDEVIEFIKNIEIDIDALKLFEASQAENYPKHVKHHYRNMIFHNCSTGWSEALKIVRSPVVSLAKLAESFRKMNLSHSLTADVLNELNINLGSLFLNSKDYELFIRCGGLGTTIIGSWKKKWIKTKIAARGMDAIRSLSEVYGRFRTEMIHFYSSPIQRVFAKHLLRILPQKDVIQKRDRIIQKELLLDKYKSDIKRGKKTFAAASEGGQKMAELNRVKIMSKIPIVLDKIIKKHKENPRLSFTQICKDVAKDIGIGVSTLKKNGIIKTNFPDW